MKTMALFLVFALTLLTIGCEDSAMTRYSANPVATAAPGNASKMKILAIAERLELKMPDGREGFVSILGEIRYEVTEVIEAWEAQRLERFTAPKSIEVKISDLTIEQQGDTASATFRQVYRSDRLSSTTTKTLKLAQQNGEWRIVGETSR